MKKLLSLTIIGLTFIFLHVNVKGQFVLTAMIDSIPTNTYHLCKGDTLDLNSAKSDYLMNNNFNNGNIGIGWTTNVNAIFTNPCPPNVLPAEGNVLWLGANVFPRELTTVGYNILCYNSCFVEFDMKYGANQNFTNCESPDLPYEGVHLMYSINNGTTWTQFAGTDLAPSGIYGTTGYVNGSGGYWTPVANNMATGPYYLWNHYKNAIPATAITSNTKIRWYQDFASTNEADHWGIDNVQILCPTQIYLEWSCPERPSWHYYDFNPPPFIANQAGTYHYIVSIIDLVMNNQCPQIDTITVIVHDPKVNAIPDLSICFGDTAILSAADTSIGPLSYQWNSMTVSNNDTLLVHPQISTMYSINITDSIGCKAKDSVFVTVQMNPVFITTNDTICIGDTAKLTVTSSGTGDKYLWSNSDTTSAIIITPLVTETYQLTVTTVNGCKETSEVVAYVNPLPIFQLTPNTTICLGSLITISATAGIGDTYFWSPTGETNSSIQVNPVLPLTTYTISVKDINICIDSASVDISTIPLPIPTILQETDTICKGIYTSITAGGGTSYQWNTGDITPSVYVKPLITTIYTVTVSNSLNNIVCSSDTAIQQSVRNCNVIYIPNSFMPTGYNAVFKPIGEIVISKFYKFSIYNRWGQMMFETTDINLGWDGRYNGEYVPSGAYIYYLHIDNGYEEPFEKIGTVTVIL